ncbi:MULTISPECIES: sensor histidine kinase [Sphingobacterium]|uniref:sensor histidine kinase n=2 Tax=Sphingobacterium TaxID=28453 RepID=UPI00257EE2A5|nr:MULTISPECIES: sensor histidine kinase [Sphingobacterium]
MVKTNYTLHISLISLFIIYEISMIGLLFPSVNLLLQLPFYIPAIGLFYFHALVVMDNWHATLKSRVIVVVMTLAEILIYVPIIHIISSIVYKEPFNSEIISGFVSTIKAIWKSILIIGISYGYWIARRNIFHIEEVKSLQLQQAVSKQRQTELENAYLRAQINPHFFKNTLNYVFGLVEGISKDAGEAILLLAGFVEYSYGNIESEELVDLDDEIDQIERYLRILKLRYRDTYTMEFKNTLPPGFNFKVPPMLLLTFIENISMHGYINKTDKPALITIGVIDSFLCFETKNFIRHSQHYHASKNKVGLHNCRTRLSAFYKDRFEMNASEYKECFELKLRIRT